MFSLRVFRLGSLGPEALWQSVVEFYWEPSFVLSLGHWPHISLILGGTFWGREASQRGPGDFQETTPDDPNRFLGVPLGCLWGPGLPRGAGGLKEATRATQKGPPAAEARSFLRNTQKR